MESRHEFIEDWREAGLTMTELCEQHAISRKTGYAWIERWNRLGRAGLATRSSAPQQHPNATPEAVVGAVLRARDRHPTWGPRKLQPLADEPAVVPAAWPAASTIALILKRYQRSIGRRKRWRTPPCTVPAAAVAGSNDEWCCDGMGSFRAGNGAWVQPFTLSDSHSRFMLSCVHVAPFDTTSIEPLFQAAFREYGLPRAIRSDNGVPFATVAAGGLSRLSVGWIKLGITPIRIEPGHPEQNGRHERLHLTIALETATPPAATPWLQQARFDRFAREYNHERPHEALGQRPPASVYVPSPRPYPRRPASPEYGDEFQVRRVRPNGAIKWQSREIYVNALLAREPVGLREVEQGWEVVYGPVDLGLVDPANGTLRRPTRSRRGGGRTGRLRR